MKIKNFLSLLFNLLISIFGIIGVIVHYDGYKFGMFQFYTLDSNIFLIIACLVSLIFNIKELTGKIDEIPDSVLNLKYLANCTTMVTFIIVVVVLAPMNVLGAESILSSYIGLLTQSGMLEHHLLCPLLGLLSLLIIDELPKRDNKIVITSLIFTFVYGITLIILNLLRIVDGPYPFLRVYNQTVLMSIIWVIIILTMAYLISFLIYKVWFRRKNG